MRTIETAIATARRLRVTTKLEGRLRLGTSRVVSESPRVNARILTRSVDVGFNPVNVGIIRSNVDNPLNNCRSRVNRTVCLEGRFPSQFATGYLDSIEVRRSRRVCPTSIGQSPSQLHRETNRWIRNRQFSREARTAAATSSIHSSSIL